MFSYLMAYRSDLSILYLGPDPAEDPKLPQFIPNRSRAAILVKSRAEQFRILLEKHFKTVNVVTPNTYTQSMTGDYDVTIFDSLPLPIGEQHLMGTTFPLFLTAEFSRPVLSIGAVTWRLIGRVGLNRKLDHL